MWNPVTAFLWECWRTTRRQVLFFVALGGSSGWAILAQTEAAGVPRDAYPVFMLLVGIATVASLSMLARSAHSRFPMALAYARPVHTGLLVAVPMLYLALCCAATYAVPATALRLAFGAPLPVIPVAALLAVGAVLFAACNWFTRASVARFGASLGLLVGLGPALRWIHAWNPPAGAGFTRSLSVDSVALDVVDYAVLALATAVAYVVAAYGVGRQRHGDVVLGRPAVPAVQRIARRGVVEQVRDVLMAVSRVPCPTSSPLAAELWIETTARGLPVVAIGALVALAMPVLFSLGNAVLGPIALAFIGFAAVLPFFSGMSVSFWNRETSLRAPMSTFEAVRPLPTVRLVAVQIGVAVAAIIAAWCLIVVSAWWSLPLYGRVVDAAGLASTAARTFAALSYTELMAGAFVGLVAFSSVVALSAAIRALTARHGLRLWIGAVALLAYLLFLAIALAQEWLSAALSAAVIGAHFWAVAVAIPVGTLWIVTRTLADGSLRPAEAMILAAVWLLFVAALAFVRNGAGIDGFAAPVAAGALALQLLPLTAGALAVWSLGRIRHA